MPSSRAHSIVPAAAMVALASLATQAVHAQASADVVAAVAACRQVQSPLARLDCYDRALPPVVDTDEAAPQRAPSEVPSREPRSAAAGERELVSASHAQIVEIMMPSLSTTVLVAADGRVFTRQNTTSVVRWPPAPFDVDIETSRLGGSTYLIHPRTGERVRVAVQD